MASTRAQSCTSQQSHRGGSISKGIGSRRCGGLLGSCYSRKGEQQQSQPSSRGCCPHGVEILCTASKRQGSTVGEVVIMPAERLGDFLVLCKHARRDWASPSAADSRVQSLHFCPAVRALVASEPGGARSPPAHSGLQPCEVWIIHSVQTQASRSIQPRMEDGWA